MQTDEHVAGSISAFELPLIQQIPAVKGVFNRWSLTHRKQAVIGVPIFVFQL